MKFKVGDKIRGISDNFGKYQPHFDNMKVKRFREITDNMADLYERKNKDYGDSFGKLNNEFGEIAGLIRLSDKLNRLKALVDSKAEVDESKKDTLIDLANYAIMQLMWLEGKENE